MASKGVSGGRVWVSVEDSQKLPFLKRSVYVNVPFSHPLRLKFWVILLIYPASAAFWGIFKLVSMLNG